MRLPIVVIIGVGLAGCHDSATIWSAEMQSPDRQWIAIAKTEQFGGPGAAGVQTTVRLRPNHSNEPAVQVLGVENTSAYPIGRTAVGMRWLSPTHIDLSVNDGDVDLQMSRYAGLTISATNRAVPSQTAQAETH